MTDLVLSLQGEWPLSLIVRFKTISCAFSWLWEGRVEGAWAMKSTALPLPTPTVAVSEWNTIIISPVNSCTLAQVVGCLAWV